MGMTSNVNPYLQKTLNEHSSCQNNYNNNHIVLYNLVRICPENISKFPLFDASATLKLDQVPWKKWLNVQVILKTVYQ